MLPGGSRTLPLIQNVSSTRDQRDAGGTTITRQKIIGNLHFTGCIIPFAQFNLVTTVCNQTFHFVFGRGRHGEHGCRRGSEKGFQCGHCELSQGTPWQLKLFFGIFVCIHLQHNHSTSKLLWRSWHRSSFKRFWRVRTFSMYAGSCCANARDWLIRTRTRCFPQLATIVEHKEHLVKQAFID